MKDFFNLMFAASVVGSLFLIALVAKLAPIALAVWFALWLFF